MVVWLKRHLWLFVILLGGVGLAPAYLHAYTLVGPSDILTALLGDKIIVNRAAYRLRLPYCNATLFRTRSAKRGDFVFLHLANHPRLKSGFFKRVIGLPGETIEIQENRVFVNGRPLPVKTLDAADFAWVPPSHPVGSVVQVEDGHWITFTPGKSDHRNRPAIQLQARQYFVLGDNRDDSEDSRAFGPVPEDALLGKVIAIFATGERAAARKPQP